MSVPPPVLVFHKLLPGFSYGVTNYAPHRLERLLLHLAQAGWGSVDPNSAAEKRGRGMIVSFDDAYLHLAERLPDMIARYRLRPLIFVPSGLIGRPNRWDYTCRVRPVPHIDPAGLKLLADLPVTFGSHGVSHTDLTGCASDDLKRELEDSRKHLQDLTGQPITAISYPFGRCDRRVIAAARRAGYRQGFTMAFPRPSDTSLDRGRLPVYGFDTCWSVRQKLEGGLAYPLEQFKASTIGRLAGGTVWLNRLRRQPYD